MTKGVVRNAWENFELDGIGYCRVGLEVDKRPEGRAVKPRGAPAELPSVPGPHSDPSELNP